jgi:hypothetical protein
MEFSIFLSNGPLERSVTYSFKGDPFWQLNLFTALIYKAGYVPLILAGHERGWHRY